MKMQISDTTAKVLEYLGMTGLGLLGRMLFLARADNRRFGWSLVWEIPIALAMGIVGVGVADALQFGARVEQALIVICSYLGPRALDAALDVALRRIATRGTTKGTSDDPSR